MSIELAGAVKAVTGVGAAFAVFWASVTALDARYEVKEVHQPQHEIIQSSFRDLSISSIKQEIRDIREKLRGATDPDYIADLKLDLADAIGRLCSVEPKSRECK